MKVAIVFGLMIFVVNSTSSTNPREINEEEWTSFKSVFSKLYKNEKKEMFRKKVFFENKLRITEHNRLYEKGQKTYTMGINQFSDLLPSEFAAKISCLKMSNRIQNYAKTANFTKPIKDAPDSKDWREENLVTPVKSQGGCGSCWAFSATGALEGQYAKTNENLISLSEQNLIDCSSSEGNNGCNGGLMDNAFRYVQENGGLASEESYPYDGFEGSCRYESSMSVITVQDIQNIPSGDEETLKEAVGTVGPVSVAIDAKQLQSYTSGIFYSDSCSSTVPNHGVLIVGYGTESGEDYWIVKNSWGESWGDGGYVLMSRNKDNNCGIANMASYPLL